MDITYYKKYEPIDGKWYINKELGKGAFGTVFEVERRDFTNAKSALKVITIPSSPSDVASYREENFELDEQSITSYFYGFVEDFIKEFEVMLQVKGNSNIVSIEDYDVKKHIDEIGWDIFIRMELLTPMNKYFASKSLTSIDVIHLGIDICKALEVCQKYNIVHRDIKPSNIFISDSGEFKLGDFGVARTLEKTTSQLSKKGTYTYMAPEVFKGEAYGTNVDIYSLGIVMYKLLNNNKEPFRKEKTHIDEENALAARIKGEVIPKPENAEGRLAEIVLKACKYNPDDRYESPLQMRMELENLLIADRNYTIETSEANEKKESLVEDDDTVGIFGEKREQTIDEEEKKISFQEEVKMSGLAELYPEWHEMILELSDEELKDRVYDVEEWSDEYLTLCREEYWRRTKIWVDSVKPEDVKIEKEKSKKTKYSEPTWKETIEELSDEELITRCQSDDEWQEEYLELCYKELEKRGLDIYSPCGDDFDYELNFYEIQGITTMLDEMSEEQLKKKKKIAEKALIDRKTTPKEKAISGIILDYCEEKEGQTEDRDLTVGVFD